MSTQVHILGIPRPEPDYDRLARAVLALAEELAEEDQQHEKHPSKQSGSKVTARSTERPRLAKERPS